MKRKLLMCCLAIAAMAACSKKENDKPAGSSVKYLSKMVEESDGVTTEITLAYDNKNRLIDYVEKEAGVLANSRTFIYDANGRLMKLENDHPEEGTYETYTFTYTAAGLPQKYERRIVDNDGLESTVNGTYTITDGKVVKIVEKDVDPANPVEITTNITYNGKNVTKVALSSSDNPGMVSSIELTHGGKKNPLHYTMPLSYALVADLALEVFSENEITGLRLVFGPNVVLESNTVYQYDAQGFPVSSEQTEEGSASVTKTTYQYK